MTFLANEFPKDDNLYHLSAAPRERLDSAFVVAFGSRWTIVANGRE